MYCPKCGIKVNENAHYCPRCGASIKVFKNIKNKMNRDDFLSFFKVKKLLKLLTGRIKVSKVGSETVKNLVSIKKISFLT